MHAEQLADTPRRLTSATRTSSSRGSDARAGAANNDWLPIEGLLRVYVTGWDESGGGGGPANCSYNDDPPRGYDAQGAQLWGHLVEPITLDPAVIVGRRGVRSHERQHPVLAAPRPVSS